MRNNFLITFASTHHTLKAKKMMTSLQVDYELIATPREISSECGFCLLLYQQTQNEINAVKQNKEFPAMSIYKITSYKGEHSYEKIN